MDIIKELIEQALSYPEVKFLVCHIVINLVVALAAALKIGDFSLHKVAEFLTKKLLPYVLVYFVVRIAGDAAGLGALALVAWGAIEAALVGDLLDNLSRLGLPLPDGLKRAVTKRA